MKTSHIISGLLAFAASAQSQITIETINIGDVDNAPDVTGFGAVGYSYAIGKYDVTQTQYTAFLNAVASAADPYGLYDPGMEFAGSYSGINLPTGAGIVRSGSLGSYVYSVIGTSGNLPATYIYWGAAARFVNWLQNGQPTGLGETAGSTETGTYTLNGASPYPVNPNLPTTATNYRIPSEDEWYKAAYYDPTLNGGTGGYWQYPTRSNDAPGNVVGSSPNQANIWLYSPSGEIIYSVTQSTFNNTQNYLTPVGSFTNSASAYGTFDQGGNADQWTDGLSGGPLRVLRGGSWAVGSYGRLRSDARGGGDFAQYGFRIAIDPIPEPTSAALLWLSTFALLSYRRPRSFRPS